MIESALTPVVADRIWSLERPVWFSGARLRARTTVMRLDDGSLLLHTPAPPNDALAEELRALGPVRWLVVPNCWHHLGAPAAAARFREARLVGPASALRRNRMLRLDLDLHDGQFGKLVPEFDALPLAGVPFWDETVLYHRPTQTLIGADIVCSAGASNADAATMDAARSDDRLWVLDTHHEAMISEPKVLADALLDIAAR